MAGLTTEELRALRLLTRHQDSRSNATYLADIELLARAKGPAPASPRVSSAPTCSTERATLRSDRTDGHRPTSSGSRSWSPPPPDPRAPSRSRARRQHAQSGGQTRRRQATGPPRGEAALTHGDDPNLRRSKQRPRARHRSVALPEDRGPHRHRGALLPRADLRPGRPAHGDRAGDRSRRSGRQPARVPHPFQGTIATTDGETTWAVRYSSEGKSRSLFYTTDVPTLRNLYPERQLLQELSEGARLIVSEPLGDVPGVWNEVPEASCGVIARGHDEMRPFYPRAPSKSVPVVA